MQSMDGIRSREVLCSSIDPKYFGHKFDVAFRAITTAWLRKWTHEEPISELLVKENAPGEDTVNMFDEWATYARSNAIVSRRPSPRPVTERPRSRRSTYAVSSHPTSECTVRPTYASFR
ncbi:hypothetical protein EDB84DRAFT_1576268 [Lactarius hengduanensis]|nr:hypothetical protein EDB84DRAFT_1576268 [Lactarius hengduanensis]